MKILNLAEMKLGWFIGNFEPCAYKTDQFEVGIKEYFLKNFVQEKPHFHKVATEITCIYSGEVLINGEVYKSGSIIVVEPNEAIDFKPLTDKVVTLVVKTPSKISDKFFTC